LPWLLGVQLPDQLGLSALRIAVHGGTPGTFEAGKVGELSSPVPGSGPAGIKNNPIDYGDDPNNAAPLGGAGPRDPDRFDADADKQREYRQRFIPSGLAHEIYLDTWLRLASFEPGVPYPKRLFGWTKTATA
jgi:hypothetical protein